MQFDEVPMEHLTEEGLRYQLEKSYIQNKTFDTVIEHLQRLENRMADVEAVLESFRAAVDKELLDDRAQNDLIDLLRGQVADAEGLVQAARDGEATAKAQVDNLLVELESATARLSVNDIPEPPTNPDTGEVVEPEPTQEPGTPIGETPSEEPTPGAEPIEPGPIEPSPAEPVTPGEGGTEAPNENPTEAPTAENPDESTQNEGPTPTPDNPFAV